MPDLDKQNQTRPKMNSSGRRGATGFRVRNSPFRIREHSAWPLAMRAYVRAALPNFPNIQTLINPLTRGDAARSTGATSNAGDRLADCNLRACILAPEALMALSSWPLNLSDVTSLEWWRTKPADHHRDAQILNLHTTVAKIKEMNDRRWLSALQGDAAVSFAIAIGAMPIGHITLEVDLAMFCLALCALDGSDGPAPVLSHILPQARLDHPFGKELSTCWLALNLCGALNAKWHSVKPRARNGRHRVLGYAYDRILHTGVTEYLAVEAGVEPATHDGPPASDMPAHALCTRI